MPAANILIVTGETPDFGYMMKGYITFYSKEAIHVSVKSANEINLHPIALQVMKEDGIELTFIPKTSKLDMQHGYQKIITIDGGSGNSFHIQDKEKTMHYTFNNPLNNTSYDEIVNSFRKIREEIKKISIEITGILNIPVNTIIPD